MGKLAALAANFIGNKKDSKGNGIGLKIVIGIIAFIAFLILSIIIVPVAAIVGVFKAEDYSNNSMQAAITNEINIVLQEEIQEWDKQGVDNTYPDIAMGLAYITTKEKRYDLKEYKIDRKEMKQFYDNTVTIKENVVCKSVEDIVVGEYPNDIPLQNYYQKSYSYWKTVMEHFTFSEDDTEISATTSTIATNGALADAGVKIYNTGMPIPHYLQYDPKWGNEYYGWSTISSAACGPTSAAMIVSYFTQTYITPKMAADYSQENGYHVASGTSWAFFSAYTSQYGISCADLSMNMNLVQEELKAGHPVIASMAPGRFTKKGHFIVLRGIDEMGQIYVNDPNDNEFDKKFYSKTFSPNQIYSEAKNFWSFKK